MAKSSLRYRVWLVFAIYLICWFGLDRIEALAPISIFLLMPLVCWLIFIRCENCKTLWHQISLTTTKLPKAQHIFLLSKQCPKCDIERY